MTYAAFLTGAGMRPQRRERHGDCGGRRAVFGRHGGHALAACSVRIEHLHTN
ncbi:MAG: hypothetical protein KatS3mg046_506 [Bellilinea sp.]|nr:MAG: hypothetical protein KatS3mg046_506 [Bellilinea sp.]